MGQTVSRQEFHRSETDEPHKSRRTEILAKYPQIKELYGPDIRLFPSIVAIVLTQLSLAVYASKLESWKFFILCYTIGGTLTHWLSLGNHELSHNLCFKKTIYNELLGMFANFAQGLLCQVALAHKSLFIKERWAPQSHVPHLQCSWEVEKLTKA